MGTGIGRGTSRPACPINADYNLLGVEYELDNVRKPGRRKCTVNSVDFGELADELARYMIGADDDFEKRFAPAK